MLAPRTPANDTTRTGSAVTVLKPLIPRDGTAMVTINCDLKSVYMQFYRSVFERCAPLAIPEVEAVVGAKITQGNSTRTFPEGLLTALTDAYRQAVASDV